VTVVAVADSLRREVFALAYHLHWPPSEILGLPITERRAYLQLLVEQLELERRTAEERAER
jgi:hypothetical protein